jgi:hypothetical protein
MSTLNFEPFARIEELEKRVEQLEAALRRHALHTSDCRYNGGHDCNCGLDEIRAALDQGSPPVRQENDDVFKGFRGNNEA